MKTILLVVNIVLIVFLVALGFNLLTAAPLIGMWEDLFMRVFGVLLLTSGAIIMMDLKP